MYSKLALEARFGTIFDFIGSTFFLQHIHWWENNLHKCSSQFKTCKHGTIPLHCKIYPEALEAEYMISIFYNVQQHFFLQSEAVISSSVLMKLSIQAVYMGDVEKHRGSARLNYRVCDGDMNRRCTEPRTNDRGHRKTTCAPRQPQNDGTNNM